MPGCLKHVESCRGCQHRMWGDKTPHWDPPKTHWAKFGFLLRGGTGGAGRRDRTADQVIIMRMGMMIRLDT